MRRRAAALASAIMLALAGCSDLPEGVDGDLTGSWPTMAAAKQFRPAAAVCGPEVLETATEEADEPIDCAGKHLTETIAVADLATAARIATPDAARDEAFTECSKRATAFLGGDWRTGWLLLQPVMPGAGAWTGGARWTRCDLVETDPVDGAVAARTGSMKLGLKGASALRMACANPTVKNDRVTEMHPVACAKAHTAEFAGLYVSKRATSAEMTVKEVEKGCDAAIARFADIPDDSNINYRVGWLSFPPDDTAWKLGDHAVRCFLWNNGEKMTGSYRNAGTKKLKIHYVYR
ncbi:MAG: septum formation family protein [Actinoplanes sp.]